jgi:hypothetical protein
MSIGMLSDAIRERITLRPVLEGAVEGIYLAQIRLERDFIDLYGRPGELQIRAAGMGLKPDDATARCWGELVERTTACAPEAIVRHVYEANACTPALSWQMFAPYDAPTMAEWECESRENNIFACTARGLASGKTYVVPASRVIAYWERYIGKDAFLGECDASGLASRPSGEDSAEEWAGLCEVLERDAIMMAWRFSGWPVAVLPPACLPGQLSETLGRAGLRTYIYEIGEEAMPPVVGVILEGPGSGVTFGSACARTVSEAVVRASLEAIMLRDTLLRTESRQRQEQCGAIATSLEHITYGYRCGARVIEWFGRLPRRAPHDSRLLRLRDVASRCSEVFGHEPMSVDLSVPDLSPDHSVCRVLQPHAMRKEWRHARRFRGGIRFEQWAKRGSIVNDDPHPFG